MMFQSARWDGTNMTLQQFSIVSFSRESECHNLETNHSWSLHVFLFQLFCFHESWDHVGAPYGFDTAETSATNGTSQRNEHRIQAPGSRCKVALSRPTARTAEFVGTKLHQFSPFPSSYFKENQGCTEIGCRISRIERCGDAVHCAVG